MTFAYADSIAVLGPLSFQLEPHAHDLCREHANLLTAPVGWQLVRHTSLNTSSYEIPTDQELP